ncbi:large subunit ribosomal protein L34 [Microdochium nivale]|nr:large subunit ribosomal protein L34 [Microdochium nivale]
MRSFTLAASSCRAALSRASSCASAPTQTLLAKRTFTSLPTLRPSLASSRPVFRSATNTLARLPGSTPEAASLADAVGGVAADVVPRSSVTSHPAFGLGFQIRCGPRPNLERSSRLVRKRRHGFLTRLRSRTGRKILQRRKEKKRSSLSM